MKKLVLAVLFSTCCAAASAQSSGDLDAGDLGQQLSNPVADLISIPFQLNYDENFNADDSGSRLVLNIQPVLPFSINEDWNLISRTVIPVVWSDGVPFGTGSESGLGDIVQSFFFSPKRPTSNGLIWGVGPALLLPTASKPQFGAEKWGIGLTGVVLKQNGPWTYGALANHIWSFAGEDTRADVNATFAQPFVAYAARNGMNYAINTEATYNWETDQASIPINLLAFRVVFIGRAPVSLQAGIRYWLDSPDSGPEGLGLRLSATLLFPR